MTATVRPGATRLGMRTKLAYGFGSIAYGIKDNGFQTLLLLYYNQVVGLSAGLVGTAIFIALVMDAFMDPLIGRWSDRTRTRWGRRHPFMYAAAIPAGLLYLLLWTPPTGSPVATMAYLVVVSILVRTAISFYEIPSSALAPELTSDYHERTSILGYRYLFSWIGGMTMSFVTFVFIMAPTPGHPIGQLNPRAYQVYAVVAATVMAAAILLSAFGTPVPRRAVRDPAPGAAPRRSMLAILGNRAFVMLMASGVFSFTSTGLTFALSTYLNTYLWSLDASVFGIFTITLLVGAVVAFALASRLSAWLGKKTGAVLIMSLYPLVAIAPYALRGAGLFPHVGEPALLPLLMLFMGLAAALGTAGAIIAASMMSDVVEDAELRTGERSEGLFFAGSFFMQKCVSGVGLLLSGAMLTAVRFPIGAAPGAVPEPILNHLVAYYAATLFVLGALAAWFLWKFPLGGRQEHDARLARLAEVASHAGPLAGTEAGYPAAELAEPTRPVGP
jgi:GPH family glycoside/pentoside/hexuronide:cation symporter